MRRATLIFETFHDEVDRERFDDWLARWRHMLVSCSDNDGCGCCVDMYDLEAPEQALAELPEHWFSASDWTGRPQWLPPTFHILPLTDHETE